MDLTTQTLLFCAAFSCIAAGGGFILNFSIRLTKLESRQEFFFEVLGKKIAKLLHSPDDHLGLDELLDKYVDMHYDLTHKEWTELKHKCEAIMTDANVTKSERILAAFLSALCDHKLSFYSGKYQTKLQTETKE